MLGVNHGPWAYVPADFVDDVAALGVNFIRFPGGNWGDENQIRRSQLRDIMFWADRMGAEVAVSVNLERGTPQEAAEVVQMALDEGYDIRYWSIGNEPNLFDDWDTVRYNREWRVFAEAMRAVDPRIEFVGPDISQYTGDPSSDPRDANGLLWLDRFLEVNGDMVSVVSVHRYPFPSGGVAVAEVETLLANSREWQRSIPALRETVRTTTGEDKPIAITEINSHWSNVANTRVSPDSYPNAVWWADVLGQLIAADVEIVAYFTLQSQASTGGYGLYGRADRRPTYWIYRMYQHLGDQGIPASSDDAMVTVYGTRDSETGVLVLAVVNRGADERALNLNRSGQAQRMMLTPDALPEAFEDVALDDLTIPGRSVMLLRLGS